MIQFAKSIEYENLKYGYVESSDDYNLELCSFEGESEQAGSGLARKVDMSNLSSYNRRAQYSTVNYSDVQLLQFSFKHKDDSLFTDDDIRQINRWLINGDVPRELKVKGWGGDYDISFYGIFVDVSFVRASGAICGLTYKFSTDAAYGFERRRDIETYNYENINQSDIKFNLQLSNNSDDYGDKIYPNIYLTIPDNMTTKKSTLSITNNDEKNIELTVDNNCFLCIDCKNAMVRAMEYDKTILEAIKMVQSFSGDELMYIEWNSFYKYLVSNSLYYYEKVMSHLSYRIKNDNATTVSEFLTTVAENSDPNIKYNEHDDINNIVQSLNNIVKKYGGSNIKLSGLECTKVLPRFVKVASQYRGFRTFLQYHYPTKSELLDILYRELEDESLYKTVLSFEDLGLSDSFELDFNGVKTNIAELYWGELDSDYTKLSFSITNENDSNYTGEYPVIADVVYDIPRKSAVIE